MSAAEYTLSKIRLLVKSFLYIPDIVRYIHIYIYVLYTSYTYANSIYMG
jgi:hypothetical protein